MRRWTKRSWWSRPRRRRAAPSLRAISSLAPCAQVRCVRALAEDLDRRGIRSKPRRLADGRTSGGSRFGVGALAYLLKNRFYIGEVVYRGEVHHGKHEPILDAALFEAVQGKLAAQAVARRCRLRGSPALLTGRVFVACAHPTHPTPPNTPRPPYRYP